MAKKITEDHPVIKRWERDRFAHFITETKAERKSDDVIAELDKLFPPPTEWRVCKDRATEGRKKALASQRRREDDEREFRDELRRAAELARSLGEDALAATGTE